jgi:thiol-disulfide isomerase/thioredoxin
MKKIFLLLIVILSLSLLISCSPATSPAFTPSEGEEEEEPSGDRVVLVELFNTDGCSASALINPIMEDLAQQYGTKQIILLEEAGWGKYSTPETMERFDWYVPGTKHTPFIAFNGLSETFSEGVVGGGGGGYTPPPASPEEEIELIEVVSKKINLEEGGVIEVTDESSEIYGTRVIVEPIDKGGKSRDNLIEFTILIGNLFTGNWIIGDYQGFLISPVVVKSNMDLYVGLVPPDISVTLELPYNEDKLSNAGVSKNDTPNLYRLNNENHFEKVPENEYSCNNNKIIIKINYGEEGYYSYHALTVTNCEPPDNLGKLLPGDLVYRLSIKGDNDNWLPGHVGIYVGERYHEDDGVYNVIEALGINPNKVVREYYPDITEFGNGPTYMGAREPINQSLTHINRDIIVDYVESVVGMPYALFETFGVYFGLARGDYVKGTDIFGSFNCVGLSEKAYEIAGVNNFDGLVSDYDEGNLNGVLDPDRILSPQEQYHRTVPASGIIDQNTPPEISNIEVIPMGSINTNSIVFITCNATDQDQDNLTYIWTIPAFGNFITFTKGKSVSWGTPNEEGIYTISCKVIDNYGGEDEKSINISVGPGAYTITASAGPNGSISPSGEVTVNQGSDRSFTISPDTGYQIVDVLVDGSSVGVVSSHTFTNINQDHTISATFNATPTDIISNVVAVYWTDHYPSNSQNIEHLINVFWDPYPEASGYKIYRNVNGVVEGEPVYSGPGELLYDKNVVQWHDFSNIVVGNTYSYYVTAYGDSWETAPSQETGTINSFLPPVYLVSPSDGETINNSTPTFVWSPVGSSPGGSINFGTTELWVKDLTDNKAIWDISFNDMTTFNATYNQDGQASSLISGHSYAWEVTSYGYVDDIQVAISQSEYWEFTYNEEYQSNNPPNLPNIPSGPSSGKIGTSYSFSTSTTDPDGDNIAYRFDWGDGTTSGWTSYVSSGNLITQSHSYSNEGVYYIKVKAKDIYGSESGWSNSHQINIDSDITIPIAPSKFSATELSQNIIALIWQDNSDNETGFKIERKTGTTGVFSQIVTIGATTGYGSGVYYEDSGLAANTTYCYRVRAYNAAGNSSYSNEACATTQASTPLPSTSTGPATNITFNSVTLNGTVNPNGVETGALFQWGSTTSYGNLTDSQIIGNGTDNINISVNLNELSSDTTYHFRIVATNSAGGTTFGEDQDFMTYKKVTIANTSNIGLNLHNNPSEDSPVIIALPEGTQMGVIGGPVQADGYTWWKIKGMMGEVQREGWSAVGEWLTPITLQLNSIATVTYTGGYGLRLRSGVGLDYSIITTLPDGTQMTVFGGPIQKDGYAWWALQGYVNGVLRTGWSAVGNWLVPNPRD